MIIEVLKDMTSFVIILVISILAFGVVFSALVDVSEISSLSVESDSFIASYMYTLISFDPSKFTLLEWIFFTLAIFFEPIVLLNLLISIMGDTYSRV